MSQFNQSDFFDLAKATGGEALEELSPSDFDVDKSNENKIGPKDSFWSRLDEIISWLIPSNHEMKERQNVAEHVKNVLCKCLGARMFPTGAVPSKIFLTNEPMEMTTFLCKGQEENWYIRGSEAFCSFSRGKQVLKVQSVLFSPSGNEMRVLINSMEVGIMPNSLPSLYASGLLEEMNGLIGSQSLFKRSLLLIKAWLHYDAQRYIQDIYYASDFQDFYDNTLNPSGTYKTILPFPALTTLIICLFVSSAKRGEEIVNPLQALGLFLAYYSSVDWDNYAVRSHDVVKIEDFVRGNSSVPAPSGQSVLYDTAMGLIAKYQSRWRHVIAVSRRNRDELRDNDYPSPGFSWGGTGGEDSIPREYSSSPPSFGSGLGARNTPPSGFMPGDESVPYKQGLINIIDPVQEYGNLCEKMDARTCAMFKLALQRGYRAFEKLRDSLREVDSSPGGSNGVEEGVEAGDSALTEFFFNTLQYLKAKKRKEEEPSPLSLLDNVADLEEMELWMKHAELVLGSKVTSDAVAQLIYHFVKQEGPQTLGEIGKYLQDATGNPNLSKVLKSQFHGLKKLIEGYPDLLRLGADHTFNPRVHIVLQPQAAAGPRGLTQPGPEQGQLPLVENTLPSEQRERADSSGGGPEQLQEQDLRGLRQGTVLSTVQSDDNLPATQSGLQSYPSNPRFPSNLSPSAPVFRSPEAIPSYPPEEEYYRGGAGVGAGAEGGGDYKLYERQSVYSREGRGTMSGPRAPISAPVPVQGRREWIDPRVPMQHAYAPPSSHMVQTEIRGGWGAVQHSRSQSSGLAQPNPIYRQSLPQQESTYSQTSYNRSPSNREKAFGEFESRDLWTPAATVTQQNLTFSNYQQRIELRRQEIEEQQMALMKHQNQMLPKQHSFPNRTQFGLHSSFMMNGAPSGASFGTYPRVQHFPRGVRDSASSGSFTDRTSGYSPSSSRSQSPMDGGAHQGQWRDA